MDPRQYGNQAAHSFPDLQGQKPMPAGLPLLTLPPKLHHAGFEEVARSTPQMCVPFQAVARTPQGNIAVQLSMGRDDFEDSPRDQVVAQIDAHSQETPNEDSAATTPTVRSSTRRKKRNNRTAVRGAKAAEEDMAAPLPTILGSQPMDPEEEKVKESCDQSGSGAESDRSGPKVQLRAGLPAAGEEKVWSDDTTTVMLRNIPVRYTAEELLAEVLKEGFQDTFDFFYLPIDFKTKRNRGYGFMNFHKADHVRRFAAKFDKCRLSRYASMKVLEITRAETQGFQANVAQYARKDAQRVQNPWFRPMIFKDKETIISLQEALPETWSREMQ